MRFEMGEGCVALRSLCAVRVRVRQRWVLGGRVAGSSFKGAPYINSLNTSILWTASSLLSRALLRPGGRGRSREFSCGIHTTFLARNCGFLAARVAKHPSLAKRGRLAVARTPARRFCATRPCTLYLLGHVP